MKPSRSRLPATRRTQRTKTARRWFAAAGAGAASLAGFLVTAALSAQAAAPADGGDAPIRIERCAILSRSELPDPFNGLRDERVTGLSIGFVDLRATPVSSIRVNVRYEGSSETVVEHGTFTTNVSIQRTYATFAGNSAGGDAATCTLTAATLRDGTTWSADR